jgi:DNA-binding beta-propeller fold protein YncE
MNRPHRLGPTLFVLCLAAAAGRGQEVIDSVDVGGWNVDGLTYNSKADVVYGRCLYGENFFAIDCSTNQVLTQIPLWAPNDVAYSATSNKAYCTFTSHGEDSVLVVDGNAHSRLCAVPMPGATWAIWDSVSDYLYVNCYVEDQVAVLDCRGDTVVAYIPMRGEPVGLTINTKRHKLYVHNDVDGSLAVIDMATNQILRHLSPGSLWYASCYSEVADKYYCDGVQGVAVIDGATDSVIKQIRLPQGYSAAAMVAVDRE